MRNNQIRSITFMGMYLALFFVFDWLANAVGFLQMPNGGSLGLGIIPLLLCSYHLGWKKGTLVGIVSVFLQLVIGSVSWYGIASFLLDYMIAYSVYGLASLFPNISYFYSGIFVTSAVRLLSSTLAGTIVWESPFWASLTYNASYMIPTTLCAVIIVPLLCERLKKIW